VSNGDLTLPAIAAAALLLTLAIVALVRAARLRRMHGLPGGKVLYSDTGAGSIPAKALYSPRYNLTGKPDYLVETADGLVPVEVKPGRDDPEPHESHMLQVLAYCLLLEDAGGKRPPYGLLHYRTNSFKIDYNAETRAYLLDVIEEMRAARGLSEVHRSHDQPGRCRGCAYAPVCEESLWPAR
jgi:CRISPR-associated exonuclease Cas4